MTFVFKCQGQIATCLSIWIVSIIGSIIYLGKEKVIIFLNFGPNENVKFIGIVVDDWTKWGSLMVFTMVTQTLKMLADEIISPWIINTIMDDKCKVYHSISYYKSQFICQTYYLFSAMVKFFQISISITQLDFVLVYVLTDIIISVYTTHMYLQSKKEECHSLIKGYNNKYIHISETEK